LQGPLPPPGEAPGPTHPHRQGLRGRKVPDLRIVAAEQHRITVLHYDGDFDLIAGAAGQSTRWVVPHGTIN
jgi:hypothetical protein